jgi:hypothetical protein
MGYSKWYWGYLIQPPAPNETLFHAREIHRVYFVDGPAPASARILTQQDIRENLARFDSSNLYWNTMSRSWMRLRDNRVTMRVNDAQTGIWGEPDLQTAGLVGGWQSGWIFDFTDHAGRPMRAMHIENRSPWPMEYREVLLRLEGTQWVQEDVVSYRFMDYNLDEQFYFPKAWIVCTVVFMPICGILAAVVFAVRRTRLRRRLHEGACLSCGYLLAGTPHDCCPECGVAVASAAPQPP